MFVGYCRSLSVLLVTLFLTSHSLTHAETYLAGQGGATLPQPLSGRELTPPGFPDGTKTSNEALKSSYMYGLKVGHYLESQPWLAFEAELFSTTPHIKQQPLTTTLPPNFVFASTGTRTLTQEITGQSFRVTTLALNEVFRYPGKYLQPYAGAGLGIFYARKHDPTSGDTLHSLRPGFNAQAGVRVLLFQHLSFFSEWKFNYTRFHFDQTEHLAGSNAKYNAHHLVGGIAYHF
jgi:hypothetical protein